VFLLDSQAWEEIQPNKGAIVAEVTWRKKHSEDSRQGNSGRQVPTSCSLKVLDTEISKYDK
jgi:hypothetical protein